jgi:hypothetical protein
VEAKDAKNESAGLVTQLYRSSHSLNHRGDMVRIPLEEDRKNLPELPEEREHVTTLGGRNASKFSLGGLLNTAVEIAIERRALLEKIRRALERRDHPEVLHLVSKLCGVNDEKSGGVDSGINGGTGF